MRFLVTLVLLVVAGLEYSYACSCAQAHIQEHFCWSDFVMKVRVRTMEKVHSKLYSEATETNETRLDRAIVSDIKYHVDVMRVFKMNENQAGLRLNSTKAVLYTAPHGSLCGVNLNLKNKYLLAGRFRGYQPSIDLCGLVTHWPWVSKRQRKNLLSTYAENCGCQIEKPYDELATKNKCQWNQNWQLRKCYERDTACIVNKNSLTGGCKWHRNKHLRACKLAARKPQLP